MITTKGSRFIEIKDFGWIDLTKVIRVGEAKSLPEYIKRVTKEYNNDIIGFHIDTEHKNYYIEETQIKRDEFVKLWFDAIDSNLKG